MCLVPRVWCHVFGVTWRPLLWFLPIIAYAMVLSLDHIAFCLIITEGGDDGKR